MKAVFGRLRLYWLMVGYANRNIRGFAIEHWAFFVRFRQWLASQSIDLEGLRVLDVGCGKMYWLSLLLHSAGANVTGIDSEVVDTGRTPIKYLKIARENGIERAARTLVWDWFYAPIYYRELRKQADIPLIFKGLDLRRMDAAHPDFHQDEFDLVVSFEVFEHIENVASAVTSINRILKPDGCTYIYIHNFTSLSGGHHIEWKFPDSAPSQIVPAWDHLRERRFPNIPSWLNEWREHQYRKVFEDVMKVQEWITIEPEGAALLTDELAQGELVNYSREELLRKGFIAVATPKRIGIA